MVIVSKALFRDGVAGSTSVQQIASVHRSNNSRFCGGSSLRLTRKSSKARGSALRASSLKLKNASQEAGLRDRITSPVFSSLRMNTSSPSNRNSERSEEHTSELQSQSNLVCRLLLEKKKT